MRKASIAAIIIAAVLMIAGGICCAIGSSAAKKEGFMLFPTTENGESVYTYDFTGKQIGRVSISAKKAKVVLSRGGEKSYVTVKNYNANYYRLNEENKTISFAEIEDVLSMFKFWEGFTFKGMRYVFSAGTDRSGNHEIAIHLAENEDINTIVVSLDSGEIAAESFTTAGDLSLSAKDGKITVSNTNAGSLSVVTSSGSVDVSDMESKSVTLNTDAAETTVKNIKCDSFKWSGTKKTLYTSAVEAGEFTATGTEGSITVTDLRSVKTTITSTSGAVSVALPSALGNYSTEITSKTGNIFVNGELYKLSCTLTSQNTEKTIKITTDNGPVELTSAAENSEATESAAN